MKSLSFSLSVTCFVDITKIVNTYIFLIHLCTECCTWSDTITCWENQCSVSSAALIDIPTVSNTDDYKDSHIISCESRSDNNLEHEARNLIYFLSFILPQTAEIKMKAMSHNYTLISM